MNSEKYTSEDLESIKDTLRYEDGLLNTRTSLVLTFNGLIAIAVVFSGERVVDVARWLALIIFVLNVLWLFCALEAWWVIRALRKAIRNGGNASAAQPLVYERIQQEAIKSFFLYGGRNFRIGPTKTLAIGLPVLLLVAWVGVMLLL